MNLQTMSKICFPRIRSNVLKVYSLSKTLKFITAAKAVSAGSKYKEEREWQNVNVDEFFQLIKSTQAMNSAMLLQQSSSKTKKILPFKQRFFKDSL